MIQLAPIFQSAADAMRQNREGFNHADPYNANHGDHMVEIFDLAARSAAEKVEDPLADAMDYASGLLADLSQNGSARAYAQGLEQFAGQFQEREITLDDLTRYVSGVLGKGSREGAAQDERGDVLKALLAGLAGWRAAAQGKEPPSGALDTGYLFDLGIAYMQAKARGGSKVEVIADAAVSVSPLNEIPHRAQSGRLAIRTLLEAMRAG